MVDENSDLDEIKGIGPSTADDLHNEGYENVGDVAIASPADLKETEGFNQTRAEDVHESARKLLETEEEPEPVQSEEEALEEEQEVDTMDEEPLASESAETPSEESESEEDQDPSVSTETDEESNMGDEAETDTASARTLDEDEPETEADLSTTDTDGDIDITLTYDENVHNHIISALVEVEIGEYQRKQHDKVDAVRELENSFNGADGGVTLSLTEYQLNALYRAVNQRQQEYHSNRGVAGMTGHIRDVADQIQDVRAEHLF